MESLHASPLIWLILLAAAAGAGVTNALAGGGMFMVFPALLFAGIAPVTANVTSTFILLPGGYASLWVYRDQLRHGWRFQTMMGALSVAGAWLGSELLLHTPERGFAKLVPYLMLAATLIFSFAKKLGSLAAAHSARTTHYVPLAAGQLAIGVYGGYFGAGMGVLMLALYLLAARMDMREATGIRLLCGTAVNTIAMAVFSARGIIDWEVGVPLMLACVGGGYWGARLVKSMDQEKARRVILVYAWLVTLWLLVRSW
jgi:hypothetical protein